MRTRPLAWFALASSAAVAAGCSGGSAAADMASPPDIAHAPGDLSPENTDLGPIIPPATTAVFTTRAAGGALFSTPIATPRKPQAALDTALAGSTVVRAINGKVIVLSQGAASSMRIYDPANGYKSPIEVQLPAMSNPRDVVAVPASSRYYVTLFGAKADSAIAVVDVMPPVDGGFGMPAVVKSIAVPQAAKDPDGAPEASDLWSCGSFAYATLQDLDASKGSVPSGPGRVVALDFGADAVAATMGVIQLMGPNPNGFAHDGPGCDVVLTADAGNPLGAVDGSGGIERVDLSLRTTKGIVIKDSDLKGHPTTIASASHSLAFTTLTLAMGMTNPQQVVAVDPQGGKLLGAVTAVDDAVLFAALTPDGTQLFVGASTNGAGSITAGPAAAAMLGAPTIALDAGQSPSSIAFY
jgi:hypothetical protein